MTRIFIENRKKNKRIIFCLCREDSKPGLANGHQEAGGGDCD